VPYILIQVNESIAKFFTLMVEGPFEQSYGIKMQYMHHHGIFAFTMKHKDILKIFDSLPIYHEIHVFKIICSPYNMI